MSAVIGRSLEMQTLNPAGTVSLDTKFQMTVFTENGEIVLFWGRNGSPVGRG